MELFSFLKKSPAPQAIFILGMHRSGTSYLTRIINLLGADLGADLVPAKKGDNDAGYWEHKSLKENNDAIYAHFGCNCADFPGNLPARWWELPEINPFREKLEEIAQRDFGKSALWAIKDPRLCNLLPLWFPYLSAQGIQLKCILTYRNPSEVAGSLYKRLGMPFLQSYSLWLRSVLEAERFSRKYPRAVTSYENMLKDWQGQVKRIGRILNVNWPVSVGKAKKTISEFMQPSLRHNKTEDKVFLEDASVPELVRRAYKAILAAARTGRANGLSEVFDKIADEWGCKNLA